MNIQWLVIPKGTVGRELQLTVMPVLEQSSFQWNGPFDSEGRYKNWAQWVHECLQTLTVSVDSSPTPFEVDMSAKVKPIESRIWDKFFETVDSRATLHLASSAASTKTVRRDRTTQYARTTQQITEHLIAFNLAQQLDSTHRFAGRKQSARIDQLFPIEGMDEGAIRARAQSPSWANHLRDGYAQLADIFLPVKPSLEELLAARRSNNWKSTSGDDLAFRRRLEQSYSPHESRSSLDAAPISAPVFSARAAAMLDEAINSLKLRPSSEGAVVRAASQYHPWATAAVAHLASTFPYEPTSSTSAVDLEKSPHNRLAMLLAEPGLLSRVGLLFDIRIPLVLAGPTRIWVTATWSRARSFTEFSPKTAMTASGTPAARTKTYDERGFMNLGSLDTDGKPGFMLSDFRFDEAFRSLQLAAQSDKNELPQNSPGANQVLLPSMQFSQIHSHDLALHWTGRPDAAFAQREDLKDDIHLEDLVMGIRPLLGHVTKTQKLNWYDLTARKVTYGILADPKRSELDIARDDGFAPLTTYDKRTSDSSSVAELVFTWNGWNLGLKLPSKLKTESPVQKTESMERKGGMFPFRYGTSVFMAARLVLRDGSCLVPAESAYAELGASQDAVRKDRVVGARNSAGDVVPFRLLRWERLGAPVVLHDDCAPESKWWPVESASRVVVASAQERGVADRHKSRRYIVPHKSADMHSTWKHGKFDQIDPATSAFDSAELDDQANFPTVPASSNQGGREPAYMARRLGSRRPYPYHPDPLVTSIRVWAIRRYHDKASEGVFVGDSGTPATESFELYGDSNWPNAKPLLLEVLGVKRGHRHPLFEKSAIEPQLKVRVPEGERMTLVFVPEGDPRVISDQHAFGKERLLEILGKFGGVKAKVTSSASLDEIGLIHLPYLANVTMVDVEHALDRPAIRPKLALAKRNEAGGRGERAKDQTTQRFAATIRFDPGSTGALEIYATEQQPESNLDKLVGSQTPSGPLRPSVPTHALVTSFAHSEFESVLVDVTQTTTPVLRPPVEFTCEFLQEFHDYKHHKVAYWTRALEIPSTKEHKKLGFPGVSAGELDAFADLVNPAPPATVIHVLASRKPKAPQLRYIIPTFAFSTEKAKRQVRRTRNGRLSLHMDGEWLDSGVGEKIAVVLVQKDVYKGAYNDQREKYDSIGSFWGADPTKQGPQSVSRLPDYMVPANFATDAKPVSCTLWDRRDNAIANLSLILFEPEFCLDAKSWRVEIPLVNPTGVSRPFVRLAFARYQEHALEKMRLSDIVAADYAQLSDTREAVIISDPSDEHLIHVTIYGNSFEGDPDSGQARMLGWLELYCSPQVEGVGTWVAEGDPIEWQRTVREGRACWHGHLRTSESMRCNRYRVSILEEEEYKLVGEQSKMGSIPVYFDLVPVAELD